MHINMENLPFYEQDIYLYSGGFWPPGELAWDRCPGQASCETQSSDTLLLYNYDSNLKINIFHINLACENKPLVVSALLNLSE
jgi:hypothetical protein